MAIEMRVVLQQRDTSEEKPKWRNVNISDAFTAHTLTDYNGLAIDVVLEAYDERIRRTLQGTYGT